MSNKVSDSHEDWMKRQIESVVKKVESGRGRFITNSEVKEVMRTRRVAAANKREPIFGVLCGGSER